MENSDCEQLNTKETDEVERKESEMTTDEWIDVFGNGDFCRKILKVGVDERKPTNGDKVEIKVSGRLYDQTIVDDFPSISFVVGLCDVIQAWELAVPFMTVGEVNQVKTKSRFAYGQLGRSPDIPENAEIIYEIELLNVEDGPDIETLEFDARMDYAFARKDRGNYYFKRAEYSQAIDVYQKGLKAIEARDTDTETQKRKLFSAEATLYNNLAAAQLKISAWKEALESVNRCLLHEPRNAKGLFRRGKALFHLGEYARAANAFEAVQCIEPTFLTINENINRCKAKLNEEQKQQKLLYQKMVKALGEDDASSSPSKAKRTMFQLSAVAIIGGIIALGAAAAIKYYNTKFLV